MSQILLVEDNGMNSELVKDILEMENYEVTVVGDGCAALDTLQTKSFDLILTDINLPRMDGLTLVRHMRSSGYSGLIVALTSDISTKEGSFEEVEFNGFIQKPFKINVFREYVKSILDGS